MNKTKQLAVFLVVVGVVGSGALGQGEPNEPSYWKATLEMNTVNFDPRASRTKQTKLTYQIYQSQSGIIRRELIRNDFPGGGLVGIGRDVQLIDRRNGIMLAFDKKKPIALRFMLKDTEKASASNQPIGKMSIMGFECEGVETVVLLQPQKEVTQIKRTWTTTVADFKYPLLELTRNIGLKNELMSITISIITSFERVEHLSPSLFELPEGYSVRDVGAP